MISVAMASYNGERFIEQQLKSIYEQTVPVDQVIICDDCSTDRTVEICRAFIAEHGLDDWNVYVNEENKGFCLNFYGAFEKCCGDVIFVSDQDDVWHPDKVEKMLACMKKFPDITVLASRYDVIDAGSNRIEDSGITYLGGEQDGSVEYVTAESLIGCSYIRGFSICFKRELKTLLKPIDLRSLLAHDWLLCMLGCVRGCTAILNTSLTDYRYHGDNVSLAAMNKKTIQRSIQKRIRGVKESIEGHSYVASLMTDKRLKSKTDHFVAFEKKRLVFLTTRKIAAWLSLVFEMREYRRYYKSGGLRVWIGDFIYVYFK